MANTINLGRVKGSMWYTGTADSAADIASAISGAGYTPVSMDLYLNVSNGNIYQYVPSSNVLTWTLKGNIKGAKGDPFAVAKTYASVAAMNAGYATDGVKQGQFVIVETGNVDDEENARLYVKGAKSYEFITDLSGAQGIKGDTGEKGAKGDQGAKGDKGEKGDTGAAAGFATTMGVTVKTLAAGSEAVVTVEPDTSTPSTAKKFNFTFSIPQGAKGDTGSQGAKGETGAKGDTGAAAGFGTPKASATALGAGVAPTVTVTTSGDATEKVFTFTFGIPKGDKGDKGTTGDKGADGKTPTLSINANGELIATFE